jgi:LmbE family N-acetylglucosaminyl deacetylase
MLVKISLILLAILVIATIIFWLIGFFISYDHKVPTKSIKAYKKVLFIFPHPDDEVLTVGGFTQMLAAQGSTSTYLILTKGERGTEGAKLNISLKKIRTEEAKKVAQILNISKLIHKDFGDGQLKNKKKELEKIIQQTIENEQPDLIVTYDLAGLYGHDDHIAVAEITTDLVKKKFKQTALWYTTHPKRILAMVQLPEHMATDKKFKERRAIPTHKIFIGLAFINKSKAAYAYKSQFASFEKAMPFRPVPPAFLISMNLFEYYTVVQ